MTTNEFLYDLCAVKIGDFSGEENSSLNVYRFVLNPI
jgi:hypothetical protein